MEKTKKQKVDRAEDGTLKKGTVLNPNGRPKGATNRTTKEIRDLYTDLLMKNIDKIQEDLEELEPHQRLRILLELSKFILPQLRATEQSTDINPKELLLNIPVIEFVKTDEPNIQ